MYTLPIIRMGASEPTSKMIAACRKGAKKLYSDTASGKLHSPALSQVFFYQLWRNMSKTDKATADYRYWHDSNLVKHEFQPDVRLGFGKGLFGKVTNRLLGQMMKV